MSVIPRRHLLALPCALAAGLRAAARTVRGRFTKGGTLITPEGRRIKLDGDESARKVYDDERLEGVDFEVEGEFKGDVFVAEPIHKRPLWAWRNGERRMVTYWCWVCFIRTYAPGPCWCCQAEFELDFKDPSAKDPTP